ncbi:condensation domain-containing protein [Rapidithrix thailandica]|uniref:Condensation domain-containing protein n=1 Tax=Rapidithrix thailandica TaxID=413964 RepID=A0AAW9SCW3_9BACT
MKKIIHQRIEYSCKQFGPQTAVEEASGSYTYQQLSEAVNRLSTHILRKYPRKGGVVMVLLPRGFALVASLLASLKTGKVFLPVSPHLGQTSWNRIYDEVKPELVITNPAQLPFFNEVIQSNRQPVNHLLLTDVGVHSPEIYQWCETAYKKCQPKEITTPLRFPPADPQDSCYLYFTSGSTGQPKIVEGKLISLSHFIDWQVTELNYSEKSRVSQLAAPTFDASLKDMLPPLVTGGTLCIPSEDTMANIKHLHQWLQEKQISTLATVPSVFRALMQEIESANEKKHSLPSLRQILLAGEVLFGKDLFRWQKLEGSQATLINLYGTTESTILKSFHRINLKEDIRPEEPVSIGKPIGNTALLLLNEHLEICGVNEPGEVYIKTPFLSKGYFHDPKATEEIFVTNPLTGNASDILYKTGDTASYLPDGSVKLLGRKDRQVKRRGIRINLSGISASILSHDAVSEVYCMLRQDANKDPYLVGYFVGKEGVTKEEIRQYAQQKLNRYEVPDFFVQLNAFPLNPHGKLAIDQLPDPLASNSTNISHSGKALTQTEKELTSIWQAFFKIEKISPDDSFLQIGGNSLKAIQMGALITRNMNLNLGIAGIQQLFKTPVLRDFAAYLDIQKAKTEPVAPGISPAPPAPRYPVSFAQQQIYMACQTPESNQAYNMPNVYQIKGLLQPAFLLEAFTQLIKRFEILRTSFQEENGEIYQEIHEASAIVNNIVFIDLQNDPTQEQTIARHVSDCTTTVFELNQPGQLQITLLQTAPEHFVLAINIHHIIGDSWSAMLMAKELFTMYRSFVSNLKSDEVQPLPYQFKDYAVWERKQLQGKVLEDLKNYWTKHLGACLPKLNLHTDHTRPESRTMKGQRYEFALPTELTESIHQEASGLNVSSFAYLMSAFYLLLFKYSADEEIIIGLPIATRNQPGLEDQLGVFVNTLAIKTKVDTAQALENFIQLVHQNLQNGFKHQMYPFQELVNHYSQQRERHRTPIFDVAMNMLSSTSSEIPLAASGIEITNGQNNHQTSKFDLTLYVYDDLQTEDRPFIEYNTDLFGPGTIQRFVNRYISLLKKMKEAGTQSLNELLQERVEMPKLKSRKANVSL